MPTIDDLVVTAVIGCWAGYLDVIPSIRAEYAEGISAAASRTLVSGAGLAGARALSVSRASHAGGERIFSPSRPAWGQPSTSVCAVNSWMPGPRGPGMTGRGR